MKNKGIDHITVKMQYILAMVWYGINNNYAFNVSFSNGDWLISIYDRWQFIKIKLEYIM